VYIQNVQFPAELVTVLTQREIAKQEKATFEEQERAQTARINVEKAKGTADMQGQLASSQVSIDINRNRSEARKAEAEGEAAFVERTGQAEATKVQALGLAEAKAVEALGLARAEGFKAQREALGTQATAIVAVANAVAEGRLTIVPEVLVTGGSGSVEGLAATLMRYFGNAAKPAPELVPAPPVAPTPPTPGTTPATPEPPNVAIASDADPVA
jgi:uncharacterized membrane protein YqiK